MKLSSEPRNLGETKKQAIWCLQHAQHEWKNKCFVGTQSIFSKLRDWGSYTAPPNGHRDEHSKKKWYLVANRRCWPPLLQLATTFCISVFGDNSVVNMTYAWIPLLSICSLVICQPPSKFLNRKWKSSWPPATTDTAVASLFPPGFSFGLQKYKL